MVFLRDSLLNIISNLFEKLPKSGIKNCRLCLLDSLHKEMLSFSHFSVRLLVSILVKPAVRLAMDAGSCIV